MLNSKHPVALCPVALLTKNSEMNRTSTIFFLMNNKSGVMRTIYFTAFVAAVVLFGSCTKSEQQPTQREMVSVSFAALSEKSTLGLDGKTISWEGNDKIGIYDGTQFNAFVYNKETGKFDGDITAGSSEFIAVYPYEADKDVALSYSENKVRMYVPSYQVLRKDNLPQHANVSSCRPVYDEETSTLSGTMLNLMSVLKFTLIRDDISKVMFSAAKGKFSGATDIQYSDAEISCTSIGDRCVVCGSSDGGAISPGTYYCEICPCTGCAEFKITLITVSGDVYEYSDNSESGRNFKRCQVYNFGTIDAQLSVDTPSKWCLPMNFVKNNTNTPASQDKENEITVKVTQNGTDYSLSAFGIYQKSGNKYLMWNHRGKASLPCWIKSLPVEGKKLSYVVVVFYGNTANCTTTTYLKTADLNSNADATVFQTSSNAAKLPNPIRITHIFTPSSLEVYTSYALWNKASASCIEYIGFVYE